MMLTSYAALFLPEPPIQRIDADTFRVTVPVLVLDPDHVLPSYAIPAGFVTDLASVPRVLWGLIDRLDCSVLAAVAHDWAYRHAGRLAEGTYTRAQIDRLFRSLMTEQDVSAWRRNAAYAAVRLFGGSAWRDTMADGAR